jgi:hypothetical protein
MSSSLEHLPALAAFLKGDDVRWEALGIAEREWEGLCDEEELGGLIHVRLAESEHADEWPESIRNMLARRARADAAAELLRAAEIRSMLADLAHAGIKPILLKGTPLAYSVYDTPACRPRSDTDLLVRPEDVDAARRVMAARGYSATVHCSDLFSQFEMQKEDEFGVRHVFDVHWKISTQPVFAEVLTYDEVLGRAEPVAALGELARTTGTADALLLACVHPVMHHGNIERALWMYDIHLLASRLSDRDFESFIEQARRTRMAAVCAHELRLAQNVFQTNIPAFAVRRLLTTTGSEPSAVYLERHRRWHHELLSSVRGLRSWRERLRWLRRVLFPSPRYMRGAYHLSGGPLATLLLPALYVHRNVRGGWRILVGQK